VALLLADPVANIIATVGVLRAGAVFAALDHRQPAARREACLLTAAPAAIVTDIEYEADTMVLRFSDVDAGAAPDYAVDGDAPCYLYFTSGSTGTPKGVLGRRASLAHFIDWEVKEYRLDTSARVGQLTNPGFDVYLRDVFAALCAGGTICIPDSPELLASGQLCAWLEQAAVTHLHCVPTVFRLMLQEELTPERLAPLRNVLLAGEMLLPADVNPWLALFGARIGLTNLYGPTETTLAKFFHRLPALEQQDRLIPVGRPLPGAQALVLNESMELCPEGELFIRTPYRSLGYAGRPDLTAAAFVPNPFGPDLLYRTGDRARRLADGQFQLLGRLDQQVKIRGVRVEPGEIEAVLAAVPGVDAAVVLAQAAPGGPRLVGYLSGDAPDDTAVLAVLSARLPDYMLPSRLVRVAAMPLSANGKVDRKRLPKADFDAATAVYAAPRNALEQAVADIWAGLLQREQVGIDDNFFALGGHSLLATQMVSKVRRLCQVELALRAVFEAPTVAQLAARIAQLRSAGAALAPELVALAREGMLPLSFAQQRLWFLDRMESERAFYLMPAAVRLRGLLDVEALRAAISAVVQRHEALRTSFPDIDGAPHQHISDSIALAMPLADLSMHPEAEREEQLRWAMQGEEQERFDLARGPLLRVRLLRMAEQDHVCLLTMHHIVSDGWSMGVLVNEIAALYAAFAAGQASPLAPLEVQYADYAHWQRNWMQGEALAAQLDFWRGRLAGAPAALDVPTDFARPDQQSVPVAVRTVLLDAAQVALLRELAQRQGASLFMALHALLCALLARWSGENDVVIGTVVAGRTREATEGLIGCFMNSLALRHRCDGAEDLNAMLGRIAQGTLDAFAHQDAPFEQVIEAVRPVRDVRHNPVFNVGFLLQNLPGTTALGGALQAEEIGGGGQSTTLDLRFVARERDGAIALECEYKTELFADATAALLLDGFAALLAQWSADPATPMGKLDPGAALLAQAAGSRRRERRHTLVVAANFTAEPLADAIGFWGRTLGQAVQLEFTPYNQVLPSLLDPAGRFAANRGGSNLVLLRLEDWVREMRDAAPEAALRHMEAQARELVAAVVQAQAGDAAPLFIQFAPMSAAAAGQAQYRDYLDGLEARLCAQLAAIAGAYPLTTARLREQTPVADYDDAYADRLGHIPYVPEMYAALATSFMRAHSALQRRPRKVIVLDCDETLWRGICGEAGALGVEITPGHAALQAFMADRHDDGMLLCLCSKNNGADVDAVFEQHPGMLLKAGHVVAQRVNWLAKSANLQSLAEQLDLGLDSFIFVDDNPVECAEVRAACPQVLVLQLPPAAQDYGRFLQHVWAFDQLVVTADAQQRTAQYRQNGEREEALGQAANYQSFLDALELKVVIAPALPEQMERVAELTRRTNQFNLNPQARHAAGLHCMAVQVSDRFGDYGLTGALFWRPDGDTLQVDAFLLSCRVLGRGVEHRIVAALAREARELGLAQVRFAAADSGRNEPALSFLASVAQALHGAGGELTGYQADTGALAALQARAVAPPPRARAVRQAAASDPVEHDTQLHIAHTLNSAAAILAAVEASLMRQGSATELRAPDSATELAIAAIWQEVLRIERIGLDDNFFALGGHSLQITQIVSRIKRTLNLEVPIGLLFTLSTVATLAAHIDAGLARQTCAQQGEEDAFDEIASLLGNLDE
jgi:amino acid adenylation domain-containing protein/FkbH-like protein